ncbi:MAG: AsmA-like C-terminal region-containing protein, partial [Bacteroidota bacterium]
KDATLVYEDLAGDLFLELLDLNHEGKGNFTQDIYDIYTKTQVSSITAKTGGIKYVNKAQGDLDVTLNVDMNKMRFSLKDNELLLNALKLKADGFIEIADNSDMTMDLKFQAPGNEFKHFLSMIPNAYTKDFASVKANGQLAFNGFIKGTYNAIGNKMPAFKVNLDVKNGDFKYPDLPMGIQNINTQVKINSPSSDFDQITVNIPRFTMKLGNNPFEAVFALKTPMSDPDIDAKMNGVIQLDELAKAFPMDGIQTLNGSINANLTTKTKLSFIDRQEYEKVDMSGDLRITNMNYVTEGLPAVKIREMEMSFNPKNVQLSNFEGLLGKSDVKAKGTIDNILAYFSPEKTMTGQITMRSNYFNADEWLVEAPPAASAAPVATTGEETAVFDRFIFDLDGRIDKLDYDIYQFTDMAATAKASPSKVDITYFSMMIGDSDVKGKGKIENVFDYLYKNEVLTGQLNLNSKYMDLNQFMVEEPGAAQAKPTTSKEEVPLEPLVIPERVKVDLNAKLDKVRYTNIDLKNVSGKIEVDQQALAFKNCNASTLGGNLLINGAYDTKNPEKPQFDLDTKVQSFQFQKAFDKLNSFQALAPIGQFIQGKFNTTLKMKGELGKDMMPDLNTLTADGFFHTLNGAIKSFTPLEKLGDLLQINNLKNLKIKDTKNWFELKDGTVVIKEFDYKLDDIAMKISGKHGLNQEMDYKILTKIPRKLLEKNAVGAAANKGLNLLSQEAAKYGVNIDAGEFINVRINLLGSATAPKIKITPTGSDGQSTGAAAGDMVDGLKNKAVDEAKKKLDEEKSKVEAAVNKQVEEAKTKVEEEVDKKVEEAKEKVTDKVEEEVSKKVEEAVGEKAKDEVDKLKDKVDKWNPFKKKKKKKEGDGR